MIMNTISIYTITREVCMFEWVWKMNDVQPGWALHINSDRATHCTWPEFEPRPSEVGSKSSPGWVELKKPRTGDQWIASLSLVCNTHSEKSLDRSILFDSRKCRQQNWVQFVLYINIDWQLWLKNHCKNTGYYSISQLTILLLLNN